jgi:glycosyltransferase involved in cell wall biosynthesis
VLPFERGLHLNNSSFLAAAAHGKAVVSTTGPLPDPELADGEAVLLVPPNDAPALAEAMRRLRTDAGLRARISQSARVLAEETFGWDAVLPKLVELLAPADRPSSA